MKIGKMRHEVTIQVSTVGQGAAGGRQDNWADLVTCMMGTESLVGREFEGRGQQTSSTTHKWWTHYNQDLRRPNTRMRLLWDGRVFDITAVIDPDESKREMILHTVERLSQNL
jgi:SPP1 family predicted phage head-tail adaptor